jgi:hypothetical protein
MRRGRFFRQESLRPTSRGESLGVRAIAVIVAIAMVRIDEVWPNTEIVPVMARLAPTETTVVPASRRQWR